MAFAPAGRPTLATATWDRNVQLWDLGGLDALRSDPLEQACLLTGRGLSTDEGGRYIPDLAYEDSCLS